MATQTVVTFDGLSPETAEKLAEGMAEMSKSKLELLLSRSADLGKMDEATYQRVLGMAAAANGNGGCGWGCDNT